MKYAKINEDGSLEYAPRNKGSISNWINDVEAVLAEGYLPVEEFVVADDEVLIGYSIVENKIVPTIEKIVEPTVEEPTEPEPIDERLERINELRGKLFQTDYITCKLVEAIDEEEFNELKEIYAETIAQRREWRTEIDALLKELN